MAMTLESTERGHSFIRRAHRALPGVLLFFPLDVRDGTGRDESRAQSWLLILFRMCVGFFLF